MPMRLGWAGVVGADERLVAVDGLCLVVGGGTVPRTGICSGPPGDLLAEFREGRG